VWTEWRLKERKAEGVKNSDDLIKYLLSGLAKFKPVRFKSKPGSIVELDGLPLGKTTKVTYLNSESKYHIKLSVEGYESWEEKEYQLPKDSNGEIIDKQLSKQK
jgi:PEGA domain